MNKKKVSVPVITLYVLAVIFLLIGAFSVWHSYEYISGLVTSNGFSISDNMKDVCKYYFTECSSYFAYAFLLYTGGVIIDRLNNLAHPEPMKEVVEPQAEAEAKPQVEEEVEVVEAEIIE